MSVIEKAHELGNAMADSEELTALKNAEAAMEGDTEASKLLREYKRISEELLSFKHSGREPDPQLMEKLEAVQGQMEAHPLIKAHREAQLKFNNLVEGINFILNRATGQDEQESRPHCGGGCCGRKNSNRE
ncbi:MAG: YlbF family regulator [Bacillota bacterium]